MDLWCRSSLVFDAFVFDFVRKIILLDNWISWMTQGEKSFQESSSVNNFQPRVYSFVWHLVHTNLHSCSIRPWIPTHPYQEKHYVQPWKAFSIPPTWTWQCLKFGWFCSLASMTIFELIRIYRGCVIVIAQDYSSLIVDFRYRYCC